MHILNELKPIRVQNYTQVEIAKYLGVSRRKLINFENGEIDFILLTQYAGLLNRTISFMLI